LGEGSGRLPDSLRCGLIWIIETIWICVFLCIFPRSFDVALAVCESFDFLSDDGIPFIGGPCLKHRQILPFHPHMRGDRAG